MTTACPHAPRDEENRGKNNKLIWRRQEGKVT